MQTVLDIRLASSLPLPLFIPPPPPLSLSCSAGAVNARQNVTSHWAIIKKENKMLLNVIRQRLCQLFLNAGER